MSDTPTPMPDQPTPTPLPGSHWSGIHRSGGNTGLPKLSKTSQYSGGCEYWPTPALKVVVSVALRRVFSTAVPT